jgi:hypothetical protein
MCGTTLFAIAESDACLQDGHIYKKELSNS